MAEFGKFERYLLEEFYDDYRDGHISRRAFIRRVAYITGSMAAAAVAMSALGCGDDELPDPTATVPGPDLASPGTGTPRAGATAAGTSTPGAATLVPVPDAKSALSVSEGDPMVRAEDVRFPSGADTISGYLARPATASGDVPAVLVCHENAGLTPHIRDVARRFAKEGYAAIAVDLLSREGGTASLQRDQVPGALTQAGTARHVADFDAARQYLGSVEGVDGDRVGMIGFCFGGGVTWEAVTRIPELRAAAPFYGPAPDLEAVPGIRAAVFGVYAELDNRINSGMEALQQALEAAGVTHEFKVYPGVGHAFHNDTSARWDDAAREQSLQAWRDTLAWFQRYLKA